MDKKEFENYQNSEIAKKIDQEFEKPLVSVEPKVKSRFWNIERTLAFVIYIAYVVWLLRTPIDPNAYDVQGLNVAGQKFFGVVGLTFYLAMIWFSKPLSSVKDLPAGTNQGMNFESTPAVLFKIFGWLIFLGPIAYWFYTLLK